jgi:hypothetical protein
MTNLSHIFPSDYLNPPTEEDLQFEVQEMLCRYQTSPDIMRVLRSVACPYYREALSLSFMLNWHRLEQLRDERTGYFDCEGAWMYSWMDIDCSMRHVIKEAHREQVAIEANQYKPVADQPMNNQKPTTMTKKTITQTSTTMNIIINGPINGFVAGNVENFYNTQPATQPTSVKQPAQTAEEVQDVQAIPAFFRTDSQSITKIEAKWQEALQLPTKTKVIRFVDEHARADGYFRLGNLSNQQRAEEFNKAQNKFVFTVSDFENANRSTRN